ncbi:unnamed protein product [Vicia faba]|uniref:Uncharacterized protein n=1 Tax=Vicia faba TaxID=3906 RepID=A0AAV1B762_VICFA|nr:unnamed protein product [Vicia faba]
MILTEKEVVWVNMLRCRYGNIEIKVQIGDDSVLQNNDFIWWRDVVLSDNATVAPHFKFVGSVQIKLRNDSGRTFWQSSWLGLQSLQEVFPEFFQHAINTSASVEEAVAGLVSKF